MYKLSYLAVGIRSYITTVAYEKLIPQKKHLKYAFFEAAV